MKMKSLFVGALACVFACALCVGCTAAEDPSQAEPTEAQEQQQSESQAAEPQTGGWAVSEENESTLSDEDKLVFEKAASSWEESELTPLRLLATQVVAGTNRSYLCLSSDGSSSSWVIAVVYEDLEGKASVSSVKAIDLNEINTSEEGQDMREATGGWAVQPQKNALSEDVARVYEAGEVSYPGVQLTPTALLGTQVVSGTNYVLLASGATESENPWQSLFVVKLYEKTDGSVRCAFVGELDLLSYV